LTADREHLKAEFGDLAYITVEIVDENGLVVKHAENEVILEAAGAGELIALGTANPVSEENYGGSKRKAFGGRVMAVVRSSGEAGEIVLKASAIGLAGSEIRLMGVARG
jgi:beta-galactosidase